MLKPKAIVVGAGVAGLASAIRLVKKGYEVEIYEQSKAVGGKIASFEKQGFRFDKGPSLFTLPYLVDELYDLFELQPSLEYTKLDSLCRYFYQDGTVFSASSNIDEFATSIEKHTKDKKRSVLSFFRRAELIYKITNKVFLERSLHTISGYLHWDTLWSLLRFHKIKAFQSYASYLRKKFKDEKTRQLFGRFATYNGSNPYLAPATLSVIPHIEHKLGAYYPKGGMIAIAKELEALALKVGVQIHLDSEVDTIVNDQGFIRGIQLGGVFIPADIVLSNVDVHQTYRKLLKQKRSTKRIKKRLSSSAYVMFLGVKGEYEQLELHNIFFSKDYKGEFQELRASKVPEDPTIYLYISKKEEKGDAPDAHENWFCMINVPAGLILNEEEEEALQRKLITRLSVATNINLDEKIILKESLSPLDIELNTGSSFGAIYGNNSDSIFSAFLRHPNYSPAIKGLYFAGGSVHPGGGIPLCLLSAKIAVGLTPVPRIIE